MIASALKSKGTIAARHRFPDRMSQEEKQKENEDAAIRIRRVREASERDCRKKRRTRRANGEERGCQLTKHNERPKSKRSAAKRGHSERPSPEPKRSNEKPTLSKGSKKRRPKKKTTKFESTPRLSRRRCPPHDRFRVLSPAGNATHPYCLGYI